MHPNPQCDAEKRVDETRLMSRYRNFIFALAWLVFSALAAASPYRGVVTFGGLPLPGATVTATQGATTKTAVSDGDGAFQFDDLADGKWTIDIQMQTFAPVHAEVTIAPSVPAAAYDLKLLSPEQIQASAQMAKPVAEAAARACNCADPATAAGPAATATEWKKARAEQRAGSPAGDSQGARRKRAERRRSPGAGQRE